MTQSAREPRMTYAEYLVLEEASLVKHELWDGELFAVAGGSFAHSAIAANLIGLLVGALRGTPCRVFTSDTRIRPPGRANAAYPDVSVICGGPLHHADDRNAATNPIVLVEVLSDSTEAFDRGDKLAYYRQTESLQSYVLVSQLRKRVEVYDRDGSNGSWVLRVFDEGDARIGGIDTKLAIDAIYEGTSELPRV